MKRKFIAVAIVMLLVAGIAMPSLLALDRNSGDDRYATAVEVSKAGWEDGASVVILARGDFYADALAGVPLAYANNAPILLTRPNELPTVTRDEIIRLKASKIYILGGQAAISKSVEDRLESMGIEVQRISGSSRYATATAIAEELGSNGPVFLVSGENFPDALSAASYAAVLGAPILLVRGNEVPEEVLAAISALNPSTVYVIGGTAVISDGVFNQLPNPQRISGSDRYGTAVALAEFFAEEITELYIASGLDTFGGADALAGAALAAKRGTGILLVGNTLPDSVAEFLGKRIQNAFILGGKSAVSAEVARAIEEALYSPTPDPGSGPAPVPKPESDFGFTAPEIVAGTADITGFDITVKNVANIGDDVPIRYLMKITEGNLAGKVIGYGDGDDAFTIDGDEAYFGPAAGFTLTQLPALKGATGVTTPFTIKEGLAAGTYKFTVSIVEVGGGVLVTSDEFLFNVAATDWFDDSKGEFTIYTAAELAGFANLVNNGTDFSGKIAKLGNDIDLADYEWTPIGTETYPFKGTFNGDSKTISNLKINKPTESYKGLFGVVGTDTVIQNLQMVDVSITGYGWLGSVAGFHMNGSTLFIDNVDVTGLTLNGHRMIGGILGQSYNGGTTEIKNCDLNDVTINNTVADKGGNGDKTGGIIGHAGSIKLTGNTVKNLNLFAYRDSGGIAGYSENLANITGNTVTTATLKLDKTQEKATGDAVDTKRNLGAIVGRPQFKTLTLGAGNTFTDVTSSIKNTGDADYRVLETVAVGYTPITVGPGADYPTVAEAITAAVSGDFIELIGDLTIDVGDFMNEDDGYAVTIGKDLTLDLNGHTVSAYASATVYISPSSELTLRDTAGGGKIVNTNAEAIGNNGSLTMESGALESDDGYALYNYYWDDETYGQAAIKGGTMTGWYRGIANCGVLEISGGDISGGLYDIVNSGKLLFSGSMTLDKMWLKDGEYDTEVDGKGTMIIGTDVTVSGQDLDSFIDIAAGASITIDGTNNFFGGDTILAPVDIPGNYFVWDGSNWVKTLAP